MTSYAKLLTIVVIMLITMKSTCSHRHRRYHSEEEEEDSVPRQDDVTSPTNTQITPMQEKIRIKNSLERGDSGKGTMPFNPKRLEKMLEKAIFKIITGDLSSADMLLLKSLNYSLEQVLAIREREFDKKRFEDEKRVKEIRKNAYEDDWINKKNTHVENQAPSYHEDFEAYNRQAVIDYENLASKTEAEGEEVNYEDDKSTMIDYDKEAAMEPRVIFKIRYDDSEFDSSSDEVSKERLKNAGHSFLGSTASSTIPPSVFTDIPVVYRLNDYNSQQKQKPAPVESSVVKSTTESYPTNTSAPLENTETIVVHRVDEEQPIDNKEKKVSEYEGLEWVEDDVYRVIPSMAEAMDLEDKTDNETSSTDYEDSSDSSYRYKHRLTSFSSKSADNDMIEYQNDTPDPIRLFMASANISEDNVSSANLSAYQQLAMEHRRDQGKKAIEEIKMKVLAFTGRFNLSSNINQVQPKKLTMFKPSCRIPGNTDPEAWADPFLMNMYFELNVSTSEHVVAAKLRIFQLPQQNLTNADNGNFEDVKKVKKIRISVSYYTKSLKKHRSKKRLMDSFVTSLIPEGNHLALDVKDSLEYWGLNPRNSRQGGNGGNHGLVIQVEDQDERPLKPSLYIQQSSCSDHNEDEKTNVYLPFSSEPVLDMFESLMENQ